MRGHIRKRGNKWAIVVDVGIDNEGKRKQKWFSGYRTKKEAEAAMGEILKKFSSGEFINPSNITLREYLDQWLADYAQQNVRASTYQTYTWSAKSIIPALGHIPLSKLRPHQIQSYYTKALNSGLSATSVHYHHSMLKQALKHAVKWQLITHNPVEATEPPAKNKYKANVLDANQLLTLIEGSKDTIIYIPILLAATCGLRRGEICGLRWSDVNFNNGDIYIRNSLDWEKGKLTLRPVKTDHSERPVKLTPSTVEVLKKHKKHQAETKLQMGPAFNDQGFVWAWNDGRPHDPDYLYKRYIKLLAELNLPRVRFHDLRHTHATLLLQEGVPIKVVSERLGHSTTSFTQDIYSHVLPNMQEAAANAFDNLLQKEKNKA